jgi:hypothetical protein
MVFSFSAIRLGHMSKKDEEQPLLERFRKSLSIQENNKKEASSVEPCYPTEEEIERLWELFRDLHHISLQRTYLVVSEEKTFTGQAVLCWVTDVCDILLRKDGQYILRRKRRVRLPRK